MNIIQRVYRHYRHRIWLYFKNKRNKAYRKRYTNSDVSIISMNCTGGILYHDLGLKFLSPTVNLFMRAEHFIKFCENLEHYLSIDEFRPCTDKEIIGERKYPIVYLDDLLLFLVHYHNGIGDAQAKWNERKKRINWEKICIVNTDREGMTSELKDRFEKLPYPKVMFCHKPDKEHKSCFCIDGYENDSQVGIITNDEGWTGLRPIDQFDWVNFLNNVQ